MTGRVRAALVFCYRFLIGDDWLLAAGVLVALALSYLLRATIATWWVVPASVMLLLPASLWRATRHGR